MAKYDYDALGRQALLALIREEHAVLWSEAQAKIADVRHPSVPVRIQRHVLTNARADLLAERRLAEDRHRARGGRELAVLHLRDTKGIATRVEKAAQRKRALMATYLGWTRPRRDERHGLIGGAGEAVVHASLRDAAAHGFTLINPEHGAVANLFGRPVPGGPLDNGAWVAGVDPATSEPRAPVLTPIEVKNVRTELYPRHKELHQLLDKASQLQSAEPDRPIMPTLICRDRHYTLDRMSRDLGFRVINVRKQYIKPTADVDPQALQAIQTELGFRDLTPMTGSDPELVRAFSRLPHEASSIAETWGRVGAELGHLYTQLRKDNLSNTERHSWLDELKQELHDMFEDVWLEW